ncbi:class I SAM-dependent methyltransferase [Mucilaginibacter sp. CAU 1740]|uniref:class I SAM-dependent methyltransferase n=1 Tax=Mucilaginibacter sp. CAU 1740 TaxID=3140365 RepID=UPI00325BE1E4
MSEQTNIFYNRFSFFYPVVDVFLKPQKEKLFSEINLLPNGRLLEIGVGNGAHFSLYKKHHITGIDTSEAMLKIAQRNCPGNIQVLKMDGAALLFDADTFDYVVLSHVIAVVDDPDQLLKEVMRVLKPKGKVFILNHFTPDNWLNYIDRAFSAIAKRLHFKSFFRIGDVIPAQNFTLLKEYPFWLSYFKLLIYQKK